MNSFDDWLQIQDKKILKCLNNMTDQQKDNNFSGQISFGTAGLRGIMEYGTNCMNEVNVSKLAYAILNYCNTKRLGKVIVGYDARNNSKFYADVMTKILAYHNIKVLTFKNFVPTPVLTFASNKLQTDLGIMVTASHNNKVYNGVKVCTSLGVQISGETEQYISENYSQLNEVECYNNFLKIPTNKKNIIYLGNDVKEQYLGTFTKNKQNEQLNIIYTPLNGTACDYVLKALRGSGFTNIQIPKSQIKPDGNFTTCPSPNPEFEPAFSESLKLTQKFDADIIVATDPDGDRLGAMIKTNNGYKLLTGNEIGFLLLAQLYDAKKSFKNLYAVSTVVSSPMFFEICERYNIKYNKTLTGFKNIGISKKHLQDELGDNGFIMAYEESCGYIVKENFYDKDGVFALLELCNLASSLKNNGVTVEQFLNEIYDNFNNTYSLNHSVIIYDRNPLDKLNKIINNLRKNKLKKLNNDKIIDIIDYLNDDTGLEKSNFIEYKTKNYTFILRPSGTEPKLKIYIHTKGNTLEESKELANRVLLDIKREILNINE